MHDRAVPRLTFVLHETLHNFLLAKRLSHLLKFIVLILRALTSYNVDMLTTKVWKARWLVVSACVYLR